MTKAPQPFHTIWPRPPKHVGVYAAPMSFTFPAVRAIAAARVQKGGQILQVATTEAEAKDINRDWDLYRQAHPNWRGHVTVFDNLSELRTPAPIFARIETMFAFSSNITIIRDVSRHMQPMRDGDQWLEFALAITERFRVVVITCLHTGPSGRDGPSEDNFSLVWRVRDGHQNADPSFPTERVGNKVLISTPTGDIRLQSRTMFNGSLIFEPMKENA